MKSFLKTLQLLVATFIHDFQIFTVKIKTNPVRYSSLIYELR